MDRHAAEAIAQALQRTWATRPGRVRHRRSRRGGLRPHISVLQRYVKTADLDKVYEAIGNVLAGERPAGWELKGV
jgi:hypothetical protein